MKLTTSLSVACASAMLLGIASTAVADDAKCRDQIYNTSRKVLQQEASGNRKACVKGQTGDKTACVNAEHAKAAEKRAALAAKHADKCSPLPGFGVIADPNDIADAAEKAADNAIRYIFDVTDCPVDVGGSATSCNDKLAQRAGQLAVAQWKAVRSCAKDQTTAPGVEGCIASGIAAGTAAKGAKVTEARALSDCNSSYPTAADIIDRVECEVCHAWRAMTGLDPDCDSIAGTSCYSTHKCTFDEATDDSDLDILLNGNVSIGGLVDPVSGAVDISCNLPQGPGCKRDCTCSLQTWTPAAITSIGFVCIDGAGSCPMGEQDCDGGNALGVDALDDQQIGSCTSHADCSSQCDTHCAGLGKVQWRSGCENFCQGGARDGLACICDVVGSGGCIGGTAGVDDCPGGSCVGKNNEADTDCQCQCIDYAAGGPSAPGTILCHLAADIKVVSSLPCTNTALVDLPPVCAPVTSQSATGKTEDANELGGTIGPQTLVGASDTCANIDASITTGYKFVNNLGFFDSNVGDLRSHLTVDCQ